MQPSAADLRGATFLSLDVIPSTTAARAFVRTMAADVAGKGIRKSARRQPEAIRDFEAAVAAIVGGLLLNWTRGAADAEGTASRVSYRPMQAATFTGQAVSHRTFKDALEALMSTGYVATKASHTRFLVSKDVGASEFNHRFAARLWPTSALLDASAAAGMPVKTIAEHFGVRQDRRVPMREAVRGFELGVRLQGSKAKGKRVELPASERMASTTADVVAMNDFAARQAVTFGAPCSPPQWSRVFGPDLALHGRWYASGSSYQALPGAKRASLVTINGEPCVELDVSGSHLTCLYGHLEQPFDSEADPYVVPGFRSRDVVKRWVIATIGRGAAIQGKRWPALMLKDAADAGLGLAAWEPATVARAVLERHPILADLPGRFEVLGRRYGVPAARVVSLFVIGLEAAVLTMAMAELRGHGVLALPVHDSLIVPVGAVEQVRAALVAAFQRQLGVTPRIKVGPKADVAKAAA